ncbi:hypothetical protein BOX15_Mlig033128g3 [Macrostomum lignano]|uniref:Uncharacterized protein n=1 Tax=Macrostomum lignano TaxID=282301 RepID=A0A267FTT7_9PLAT|nr:hypothetical protein BOX15_Mlig033128g3 [Macrostomum lignano]
MTSAESSGGQVEVQCRSIGDDKYKCTYTPHKPGAYLLHINWVDRPLRGSPFTVQVLGQSEANRIVCSGEGLRQGVIGQEIKATIDTRRAGPGDLTARCHGPNKPAFCELFDHQDCAYTLSVRPQEPGKHVLVIEYNGEQVPGSPFSLRVSPAPDASKVRVFGPGIEHGVIDSFESRFVCETKGREPGSSPSGFEDREAPSTWRWSVSTRKTAPSCATTIRARPESTRFTFAGQELTSPVHPSW